jgi:two-component system response regulator FixJ
MADEIVFVVDDDADARDSLCALLESAGVAAEAHASARDFLGAYRPGRPACLIADIRMPDMDGLELQEELNRRNAGLPVIVVTGHADVPLAVRAMKAGAVDLIEKPFDDVLLLATVKRALAQAQGAREQAAAVEAAKARIASLSARERQVLEFLVAGQPNKIIAFELGISPRTVEVYRANVMTKMQAGSLSELVRMALTAAPG